MTGIFMPQNMLTEPIDAADDASELPELTQKQAAFVTAMLAGKTGADAVRAATDTRAWSQEAIWAEATKLRQHPSVRLWLAAARKANLSSGALTLESHMSELARLKEIALESGNIGAAVKAEELRGKTAGLHEERVRDVTADADPVCSLNEIAQLMGNDAAAELARQHQVPWSPQESEGNTRH